MSWLLRCSGRAARPRAPHNLSLPQWRRNSTWTLDLPVSEHLLRPPVWRHVLFAVGVGGGVLLCAAYTTESITQRVREQLQRTGLNFGPRDMRNTRRIEHIERAKESLSRNKDDLTIVERLWRANVLAPWYNLGEEDRFNYSVVALCTGVWLLWQAPPLRPFMRRSFTHDPLSGRRYTMLTSTFSHQSFTHLLFNCVAFMSFGLPVAAVMNSADHARSASQGRAQVTPKYEFGAFLVAGGLVSAAVSHVYANRVLLPRAVRALAEHAPTIRSAAAARGAVEAHAVQPSLGFSGAVYAMVTLQALSTPDASVALIFFPFVSFPMGLAIGSMVCVDALGLALRWQYFDHAAHLGGAAFGAAWYYWGGATWDALRSVCRTDGDVGVAQPPHNPYSRT